MQKSGTVVLTIGFGVFALPALIFGLYLIACSVRIHTTDVYYVEYPYLAVGSGLVTLGAGIFCCALYGASRRGFYRLLLLVGAVLGLATMVYIPDGIPHVHRSMIQDFNYLSSVRQFLGVWHDANHRFPKNEAEFSDALKRGPETWQNRVKSPPTETFYSQRGHRLPYQLVVVNDALGPRLNNVSDRPGVIYYAVSSDQQQYWVTMTGLLKDTSSTATLKRLIDRPNEKLLVVSPSGYDYSSPGH
jgi:hypothetical protein